MLHVQYIKCKRCLFFWFFFQIFVVFVLDVNVTVSMLLLSRPHRNEFSSIISHLAKEHDTLCLKHRESELHNETGRIGYRTKCYENVIPQDGEIFVTSLLLLLFISFMF